MRKPISLEFCHGENECHEMEQRLRGAIRWSCEDKLGWEML